MSICNVGCREKKWDQPFTFFVVLSDTNDIRNATKWDFAEYAAFLLWLQVFVVINVGSGKVVVGQ